jgi:hypothetical protein
MKKLLNMFDDKDRSLGGHKSNSESSTVWIHYCQRTAYTGGGGGSLVST